MQLLNVGIAHILTVPDTIKHRRRSACAFLAPRSDPLGVTLLEAFRLKSLCRLLRHLRDLLGILCRKSALVNAIDCRLICPGLLQHRAEFLPGQEFFVIQCRRDLFAHRIYGAAFIKAQRRQRKLRLRRLDLLHLGPLIFERRADSHKVRRTGQQQDGKRRVHELIPARRVIVLPGQHRNEQRLKVVLQMLFDFLTGDACAVFDRRAFERTCDLPSGSFAVLLHAPALDSGDAAQRKLQQPLGRADKNAVAAGLPFAHALPQALLIRSRAAGQPCYACAYPAAEKTRRCRTCPKRSGHRCDRSRQRQRRKHLAKARSRVDNAPFERPGVLCADRRFVFPRQRRKLLAGKPRVHIPGRASQSSLYRIPKVVNQPAVILLRIRRAVPVVQRRLERVKEGHRRFLPLCSPKVIEDVPLIGSHVVVAFQTVPFSGPVCVVLLDGILSPLHGVDVAVNRLLHQLVARNVVKGCCHMVAELLQIGDALRIVLVNVRQRTGLLFEVLVVLQRVIFIVVRSRRKLRKLLLPPFGELLLLLFFGNLAFKPRNLRLIHRFTDPTVAVAPSLRDSGLLELCLQLCLPLHGGFHRRLDVLPPRVDGENRFCRRRPLLHAGKRPFFCLDLAVQRLHLLHKRISCLPFAIRNCLELLLHLRPLLLQPRDLAIAPFNAAAGILCDLLRILRRNSQLARVGKAVNHVCDFLLHRLALLPVLLERQPTVRNGDGLARKGIRRAELPAL